MKILYIIYENRVEQIVDYKEDKICLYVKNQKIYKSRTDELTLLDDGIGVVTFDLSKIEYWKSEIEDFFREYYRKKDKYGL